MSAPLVTDPSNAAPYYSSLYKVILITITEKWCLETTLFLNKIPYKLLKVGKGYGNEEQFSPTNLGKN